MKITESDVEMISPERLIAHPKNPRSVKEEVSELAASIAQHGQTQPCIVRRAGEDKYEVLVGWRRRLACASLKRDVACFIVDLNDDQALAVLLSDNRVRTDPDPFLEADAVTALLGRPGWSIKAVSEALGKPPRWVAQRANLKTLNPAIRKLRDDPKSQVRDWPVEWFEAIAKLSNDAQGRLLPELKNAFRPWDASDINRFLKSEIHELAKATWALDDATLVPKAGPCTTCPKTSIRTPGLFDDNLDEQDVSKAICRDGGCYEGKVSAQREAKIAKFKADNPGGLLIASSGMNYQESEKMRKIGALSEYQTERVKKSDKGARPTLVLGGKDDGKIVYTRPEQTQLSPAEKKTLKTSEKEPTPAEKLRDSKERTEARRRAWIVDAVREKIVDMKAPAFGVVIDLLAAFPTKELDGCYNGTYFKERRKALDSAHGKPEAWAAAVWERLADNVANSIRRFGPDSLAEDYSAAEWLCQVIGIEDSFEGFKKGSLEAIPDPKWWSSSSVSTKKTSKKNQKTAREKDKAA